MATFAFLSDEWISETRKLREQNRSQATAAPTGPPIRMNLVVTDVPHGENEVLAHLDTSSGDADVDLGLLENPEVSVTVDYATAKSVLVDGDLGAAMEAMQLGRVQIDGDMMKLMALSSIGTDTASIDLAQKIRDITD
jgi:putative sterol carrier protein